jgi:hypothetical protein
MHKTLKKYLTFPRKCAAAFGGFSRKQNLPGRPHDGTANSGTYDVDELDQHPLASTPGPTRPHSARTPRRLHRRPRRTCLLRDPGHPLRPVVERLLQGPGIRPMVLDRPESTVVSPHSHTHTPEKDRIRHRRLSRLPLLQEGTGRRLPLRPCKTPESPSMCGASCGSP